MERSRRMNGSLSERAAVRRTLITCRQARARRGVHLAAGRLGTAGAASLKRLKLPGSDQPVDHDGPKREQSSHGPLPPRGAAAFFDLQAGLQCRHPQRDRAWHRAQGRVAGEVDNVMDETNSAGAVAVDSRVALPELSEAGVSIPSIPVRLTDGANADEGHRPSSRHSASRPTPRSATRMRRHMSTWRSVLVLASLLANNGYSCRGRSRRT